MNNTLRPRRRAFTLIELLTVIAVIGILASILIPTVGAARKAANKAKTKAQFVGYANALQNFKSTYGYWPKFMSSGQADLSSDSEVFIQALSGRTSGGTTVAAEGNRRAVPFYSFAESEFQTVNGVVPDDASQLADAFNNTHIIIRVDDDNDGEVDGLPKAATGSATAKVKVAIYSDADASEDGSGEWVYSWE